MRKIALIMAVLMMVLAACDNINTTDSRTDVESAQNVMPNLANYTVADMDSWADLATTAASGAALTSGNAPLAAGILRAEQVVQCLQDTGSLSAQSYIENQPQGIIPQAGAVMIVNQTRLNQNLLACLLTTGQEGGMTTQSIQIQPCTGAGTFQYQEDDFSYLYIGVGDGLCNAFSQHFQSLGATPSSELGTSPRR